MKENDIRAFPVNTEGSTEPTTFYPSEGMTLRDYFAAKAMGGLLVTFPVGQHRDIVKVAYDIADAMLEERNRNDR